MLWTFNCFNPGVCGISYYAQYTSLHTYAQYVCLKLRQIIPLNHSSIAISISLILGICICIRCISLDVLMFNVNEFRLFHCSKFDIISGSYLVLFVSAPARQLHSSPSFNSALPLAEIMKAFIYTKWKQSIFSPPIYHMSAQVHTGIHYNTIIIFSFFRFS